MSAPAFIPSSFPPPRSPLPTTLTRKKVRIDPTNPAFIRQDQEEEVDEFEEDIGLSNKGIKRKTVRTDVDLSILELCAEISKGYDSDSSQEGDTKKKRKKKPKAGDEDDMFTEPGPDEEAGDDEDAYGKLKRKQVKFIPLHQIRRPRSLRRRGQRGDSSMPNGGTR